MRGKLGCAVLGVGLFVAFGMAVTWVAKHRGNQDRFYCVNNLRTLSQFADLPARLDPGRPLFADEKGKPAPDAEQRAKLQKELGGPPTVPPGTVFNPGLTPDQRLSWVVHLLPVISGRQDTKSLSDAIDRTTACDAPQNVAASRVPLEVLHCFGKPLDIPPGWPAVTQYVGNGGVGADAPALAWSEPTKPHPRAGAFRYYAPTPFAAITDGTSSTVLFAETDRGVGPWLQGGYATVRTYQGGFPPVGPAGQFGGTHPGGGNFAFADHSVRFLTDRTPDALLRNLLTIAGGTDDSLPGAD